MKPLHLLLSVLVCLHLAGCNGSRNDPAVPASVNRPADHVFLNGYIYTSDSHHTVARALAVRGDRIVFVGGNDAARAYIGNATTVHDLDGKMLMPGLHDVHIHLLGLIPPDECDLQSKPVSLDEMVVTLKACLAKYPLTDDGWLTVNQWNFSNGNQPSARFPTMRAALDAVSATVPIFLRGNDGHHGATNSAGLARARNPDGKVVGINRDTVRTLFSDYRQFIGLDAGGEPNGFLSEGARELVNPPDLWDFDHVTAAQMPRIAEILARDGITTVQDAAMLPRRLSLFDHLYHEGKMTFRLTAALYPEWKDYREPRTGSIDIDAIMAKFRKVREQYRAHPLIRPTAGKLFLDGVLEGNPLADPPTLPDSPVLRPYRQPLFHVDMANKTIEIKDYVDLNSDVCHDTRAHMEKYASPEAAAAFRKAHGYYPVQCEVNYGRLVHTEAFIRDYMHALRENGFTIHVHAIGDRAVRVAVNNFAALRREFGDEGYPDTIAHAQLVSPEDQQRIGRLGLYVAFTFAWAVPDFLYDMSVNPFIDRIDGNDHLYDMHTYVMQNEYPVRSIMKAGGVIVAGSDAPVDDRDPRPFVNLAAAVTRSNEAGQVMNAGQTIDIHDAIAAYTINGARAVQEQALTGSLEAGKKADLIVLDQNIVKLAESGRGLYIAKTKVLMTMFNGRVVYESE